MTSRYLKSRLISSEVLILIAMLAVGSFSFFNKLSSKSILTISVSLRLYCREQRPWGHIRDFTLTTSGRLLGSTDNLTMTYNWTIPISNVSYTIFFTLNESSSPPVNWNYTIVDKLRFKGDFEGYVVSSVSAKGSYRLTVELRGYHLESEEKLDTKSIYTEIF